MVESSEKGIAPTRSDSAAAHNTDQTESPGVEPSLPQSTPTLTEAVPAVRATEQPSRILLALALVAGLALIALPLVLWIGPPPSTRTAHASASASASAASTSSAATMKDPNSLVAEASTTGVDTENVKLGKVWISKCEKPGPDRTPPEQCDRQPWFEKALVRAILENTACAPERAGGGTVSVAMKVDFRRRQVKVFAGKSGSIRGRSAKSLIKCVKRSVPKPDWESLDHKHTKYIIAVMATYPER